MGADKPTIQQQRLAKQSNRAQSMMQTRPLSLYEVECLHLAVACCYVSDEQAAAVLGREPVAIREEIEKQKERALELCNTARATPHDESGA